MKSALVLVLLFAAGKCLFAQTNILITNPDAEAVLKGTYDPAQYAASLVIENPVLVAAGLQERISSDSLQAYITRLSTFGNRNTGADTVSDVTGMGASRRWVYEKFNEYSAVNEDRLLPFYLQFNQDICSMGQHRNICAVLPGSNPERHGVIIIEGHIDSRCDVLCDVNCAAEGVEDNATGTALVMELARVMSAYTYNQTIVFMVTTGEEQGLFGADAFATWCQLNNIPVRAVLNNDVIGGIICGETSSPPSCPGFNNIDSTSVRLFSAGGFNSRNKQLARFIKMQYVENLIESEPVPMNIRIMSPEDRTGRGGDHIPFREKGYASMRFTSANEHGDASNGPGYEDRQHTSYDVLGVDTNNDGIIDSFFVDFNYLRRNALINANAAAMAARGVPTPVNFTGLRSNGQITVNITDTASLGLYRVAIRYLVNDWDTVFTLSGTTSGTFPCNPTGALYLSVAGVDDQGVESLFTGEKLVSNTTSTEEAGGESAKNIQLFQNRPNPFDEATWISFWVNEVPQYRQAVIQVSDLQGKVIERMPVGLHQGMNEVLYTHGYGVRGAFSYTLLVDERVVDARQMVFAN